MTLRPMYRTSLLIGLIMLGTCAFYAALRYAFGIFSLNSIDIISFLSASVTLYYCVLISNDLARKRRITKHALGFSVAATLLAVLYIFFTMVGFIKDGLGMYCSGIMGSTMTCASQPTLIVQILVSVLPHAMIIIGAIALFGIFARYRPNAI